MQLKAFYVPKMLTLCSTVLCDLPNDAIPLLLAKANEEDKNNYVHWTNVQSTLVFYLQMYQDNPVNVSGESEKIACHIIVRACVLLFVHKENNSYSSWNIDQIRIFSL